MKKVFLSTPSLFVASFLMILAGINHFINPEFYYKIMPSFFIFNKELNYISGAAEMILGLGLLFQKYRKIAGILILLMLISFFLVHISHLFEPPLSMPSKYYFLLYVRIAIQFLLILWFWKLKDLKK